MCLLRDWINEGEGHLSVLDPRCWSRPLHSPSRLIYPWQEKKKNGLTNNSCIHGFPGADSRLWTLTRRIQAGPDCPEAEWYIVPQSVRHQFVSGIKFMIRAWVRNGYGLLDLSRDSLLDPETNVWVSTSHCPAPTFEEPASDNADRPSGRSIWQTIHAHRFRL